MEVEIELLKAGDRTAWNQAYEILKAISLGVCFSTAPDLTFQDHEDVAIEAITQVLEYVEKADSFEDCKKLVFKISKNRIWDHIRRRDALKRGADRVESMELHEGFDAPDLQANQDEEIANTEAARMLAEALKQIPEQYRKVVEDFYLNGLTQQQTADRHGLKLGSIGVYLDRGLKALNKILKEKGFLL